MGTGPDGGRSLRPLSIFLLQGIENSFCQIHSAQGLRKALSKFILVFVQSFVQGFVQSLVVEIICKASFKHKTSPARVRRGSQTNLKHCACAACQPPSVRREKDRGNPKEA